MVALLLNAALGFGANPFKCIIKGDVIDRNSTALLLEKVSDSRAREPKQQIIPIHNHTFEFEFDLNETEAYELIFKDEFDAGVYDAIVFFPATGVINFKLYAQAKKDEVIGGELNNAYTAYKNSFDDTFQQKRKLTSAVIDSLNKVNGYYSPARDSIMNFIRGKSHADIDPLIWRRLTEMDKSGDALTLHGRLAKKAQDELLADQKTWEYDYISKHINILSYYLMLHDALFGAKDNPVLLADIKRAYPIFSTKYPTHSYTKLIGDLLTGFNKIIPGQKLIDVNLPDLAGKTHHLNDLAKGKVTLIDFWGSWCGPCIAASRAMVPVYNEFKGKGFNVIGIAKEYKTTKSLKIALNREKYPWINLVELDDRNGVWNNYGITNSTGMMLLVDKDGKILAVDPTAEMVRQQLLAKL